MAPTRQRKHLLSSVALVCVAVMLVASCHGSSKQASPSTAVPSTDAKGKPSVSLALHLGQLQVQAAGTPVAFSHSAADSILKLVNKYVALAITRPLFTGAAPTGYTRFFAPSLASRLDVKGHDRGALTDQGAPVMTTVTGTAKRPLTLVGLEEHGRLVMVGAQFGLTVKGMTADGPLTVARVGNLVFEPNAAHQWHISGYDIIVRRDDSSSSSTQKATTTTAAP